MLCQLSYICDLLILHSFALPLFSRVHAFAPYLFCSFPCKVNAMRTPYETTGARCRSSGPSCRPQGFDIGPQGQAVRPRGPIRSCQTRGHLVGKGVPWQAKRPDGPTARSKGPMSYHRGVPDRPQSLAVTPRGPPVGHVKPPVRPREFPDRPGGAPWLAIMVPC